MENKYKLGESDTRPWGKWKVTKIGEGFIEKEITVNPGEILSLQRHNHREEEWTIKKGSGHITLEGRRYPVKAGDVFQIPLGAWHRIENSGKTLLVFHETQRGEILDENDIERKDDKYNRQES
ncbi:MAG: phosphomannose isomerase type II C-terminal cupin domain [Firmicutes bacterium]|nr:phosphomannose isomerase type II C-terminal cupin domain [Bacillota bacterium]